MRVYLETLGCQMNRLDSELLTGLLRAAGHELTDDRRSADAVLYNTCSVRDHAENKVLSRLGADGKRKRHHRPNLVVGVLGCMAQRLGPELRRKYPQVDFVCGPGQLPAVPELIAEAAAGRPAARLDPGRGPAGREEAAEYGSGPATDPDSLDRGRDAAVAPLPGQAYVRVMRGCDNFCTYCIVPYVRGPEVSRRPEDVVEEVRRLVGAGRTQITLLGQAVNRYRWSDGGREVRFADLLERVAGVAGLRRLRFVTSFPLDFDDDALAALRDLPAACEYLHCPAQSGSDAVLARMRRGYTRGQYDELIARACGLVPGVVLAGDFIVGFPGETDADHAASADLLRACGYKNSFVFKYSPRPGTVAARKLPDDVPEAVKRRRNKELLAIQAEVGLAHHQGHVGRTLEVLVEGESTRADKQASAPAAGQTQLAGRSRWDHVVVFDGPRALIGQYVNVPITGATAVALTGRTPDRSEPNTI